MRIVCDRCNSSQVDYNYRKNWIRIETSARGQWKCGEYYLCPSCKKAFYNFMDNKMSNIEEEKHETD